MKRFTMTMCAAVAAAALTLSGCGSSDGSASSAGSESKASSSSSQGSVTRANADLVIWADQKRADALQGIAKKFGKENGVTVAVQAVATNLDTNFITADAAGNGPDIVVQGDDKVSSFVQNGSIKPVQLSDSQKDKFVANYLRTVTYQNQTWAVPYAAEGLVLIRNTSLASSAPKTFDDLVSTGESLVKSGKADKPLALQVGDTGDAFHMQPLFSSFGGYLFGEKSDGSVDNSDIGLDKAGALDFAKEISQLGEKGSKVLTRSIDSNNSISLFTQGRIPYLISGSWALSDIKKAGISYELTTIPGFAGKESARPFLSVQAFYVAAHGKNTSLAEEFVDNVVPESQTQKTLYDAEPRPPALKSLLKTESAKDKDTAVLAESAATAIPRPKINGLVWSDPLGKAEAAIVGGADPVSTMKSAAKTVAESLK